MKIIYKHFQSNEAIPVHDFIKNRKLVKYFNRETAAALVVSGKLFSGVAPNPATPFYYETGIMENESLGLDLIAKASRSAEGFFCQQNFAEQGTKSVPPLTQFKALYNMPLSFVAIEHGLTGDNGVIYASARGLLIQALHAPVEKNILLGCGKIFSDNSVASGFALVDKDELRTSSFLNSGYEAFEMFREWQHGVVL